VTDTQILDWIEAHPEYEIARLHKMSGKLWAIYDGPVSGSETGVMARAATLREAVNKAAQDPYKS
jgi:hypothetical protein